MKICELKIPFALLVRVTDALRDCGYTVEIEPRKPSGKLDELPDYYVIVESTKETQDE